MSLDGGRRTALVLRQANENCMHLECCSCIIELRKLSVQYPGRPAPAVDGVSLGLRAGDIGVLIGPSGCGKTTLLRAVAGPGAGERRRDPDLRPARGRRRRARAAGAPPHRHGVPGLRAVPAPGRRRATWPSACDRAVARSERAPGWPRCWSWWAWAAASSACRTSSPAASSSAWPWRARWRRGRSCCCWTSPSPTSTWTCASGSRTRSAAS